MFNSGVRIANMFPLVGRLAPWKPFVAIVLSHLFGKSIAFDIGEGQVITRYHTITERVATPKTGTDYSTRMSFSSHITIPRKDAANEAAKVPVVSPSQSENLFRPLLCQAYETVDGSELTRDNKLDILPFEVGQYANYLAVRLLPLGSN